MNALLHDAQVARHQPADHRGDALRPRSDPPRSPGLLRARRPGTDPAGLRNMGRVPGDPGRRRLHRRHRGGRDPRPSAGCPRCRRLRGHPGRGIEAGTSAGIFGFAVVVFGALIGAGVVLSRKTPGADGFDRVAGHRSWSKSTPEPLPKDGPLLRLARQRSLGADAVRRDDEPPPLGERDPASRRRARAYGRTPEPRVGRGRVMVTHPREVLEPALGQREEVRLGIRPTEELDLRPWTIRDARPPRGSAAPVPAPGPPSPQGGAAQEAIPEADVHQPALSAAGTSRTRSENSGSASDSRPTT